MDQDQDLTQGNEVEEISQESSEVEHIDNQETSEQESRVEEQPEVEQSYQESPRENRRVQKLIESMKNSSSQRQQQSNVMDYRQELDVDDENVYQRLNQDREVYGRDRYNEGLSQAEYVKFETRLEIDAQKVEAKYKFLDKNSPEFDPARADTINQFYLNTVGFEGNGTVAKPNLRYADFVDGVMEMSDMIANRKVSASSQNIARQASQTGIRPNGTQAIKTMSYTPEDISNMSSEEYQKHRDNILKGIPGYKKS